MIEGPDAPKDAEKPATVSLVGSKRVEIKGEVLLQLLRKHLDKRIPLTANIAYSSNVLVLNWPENETLTVK